MLDACTHGLASGDAHIAMLNCQRTVNELYNELSTNRRKVNFARRWMEVGRLSRFDDLARKLVSDDFAQAPRGREQGVEVDSGVVAHALQHVHQIFGADISRRSRRERASAQSAETTLVMRHARGEPREDIRQAHATRIVEVQRE